MKKEKKHLWIYVNKGGNLGNKDGQIHLFNSLLRNKMGQIVKSLFLNWSSLSFLIFFFSQESNSELNGYLALVLTWD